MSTKPKTAPEVELSQALGRLRVSPFNSWRYVFIWLLLISPLLVRTWFLSKVPDIDVPFDVDEFCRAEIPPGQNAFEHYREAHRLLEVALKAENDRSAPVYNVNVPTSNDFEAVAENGWSAAADIVRNWMRDRNDALTEWRRGTECSDAQYIPPAEIYFETILPVDPSLKQLSQTALCEAARLESEGDLEGASKLIIAALRCSRHIGRRGGSIERFVGSSIYFQSVAFLVRWSEHPSVTAAQLMDALHAAQTAFQMTPTLLETAKIDYVMGINSLKRSDWPKTSELVTENLAVEPALSGIKAFYWIAGEPESARRVIAQILVNQLPEIDKPAVFRQPVADAKSALLFELDSQALRKPNQLAPAAIERAIQRSPVAAHFVLNFLKRNDQNLQRERALQVALEVTLAAQAYRRENGQFPDDIAALVPSYLKAVPVDPSDKTGRPIRYQREDATSAFVWSVGPGGTDGDIRGPSAVGLGFGFHLKLR